MGSAKHNSEFYGKPLERDEILIEKPGAVMAFNVDPLNQTSAFVIENVSTTVSRGMPEAKAWSEEQVGKGAQIVFFLDHEGWHLGATDSDFKFSEAEIRAFFSQDLLQDMWLTHHPVASARRRYLETLKGQGIH